MKEQITRENCIYVVIIIPLKVSMCTIIYEQNYTFDIGYNSDDSNDDYVIQPIRQ